ncbi:hypothetical protein [Leifsonia poae]|uniref:hypothetical protein n=1 Tax=Leifsonia poae TaxID=110933 RepID=UPI001CBD1824|nr:hypothetical protein [Leifsonia poae]
MAALALSPLAANAAEPAATATITASDMQFTALTSANAAQFGYEIRVDAQGYEYGVPIGTPAGSHEHATGQLRQSGGVSTFNEVVGNCGKSNLWFRGQGQYSTSYYIYPSWGAPISHGWSVQIGSAWDAGAYDLSGWNAGNQSWNAYRTVTQIAPHGGVLSANGGGYVVTTGGVCQSGALHDSIIYN